MSCRFNCSEFSVPHGTELLKALEKLRMAPVEGLSDFRSIFSISLFFLVLFLVCPLMIIHEDGDVLERVMHVNLI